MEADRESFCSECLGDAVFKARKLMINVVALLV
jgi:hypothetical protein